MPISMSSFLAINSTDVVAFPSLNFIKQRVENRGQLYQRCYVSASLLAQAEALKLATHYHDASLGSLLAQPLASSDVVILTLSADENSDNVKRLLEYLDDNQIEAIISYGELSAANQPSLPWPQGHILINAEDKLYHSYLTKPLAQWLTTPQSFDQKGNPVYVNDKPLYPIQPLFYRLVEIQASQLGENTALVWETPGQQQQSLSYDQMNRACNRLAWHLLDQHQIQREELVAVYLPRGPQLVTSLFGVMKSGGAYVPLECDGKRQKLEAISSQLLESQAKCLITTSQLKNELANFMQAKPDSNAYWEQLATHLILLDESDFTNAKLNEKSHNPNQPIQGGDLAYVMYTSGSTGKPKGVEVAQRGLTYSYESHQDLLQLNSADRVLQFGSIAFDASLMEMMMALGSGASLYCINNHLFADTEKLASYIERHKINIIIQTPKALEALQTHISKLGSLRAILFVGDKFEPKLRDFYARTFRQQGKPIALINGYGLTESTIVATLAQMHEDEPHLSIGEPILGLSVHLRQVDKPEEEKEREDNPLLGEQNLKALQWLARASQAEGELVITGPCVARGYWGRPDLTAQRFAKLTLGDSTTWAYRTGDRCRYGERQDLQVLGRYDRQIKLRGQRLELPSVEAMLGESPLIARDEQGKPLVRVLAKKNPQTGGLMLIAFMVPQDKARVMKPGQPASPQSIAHLQTLLAEEQLKKHPRFYYPFLRNMLFIEALPIKPGDKRSIDEKELAKLWPFKCSTPQASLKELMANEMNLPNAERADLSTLRESVAKVVGYLPDEIAWDEPIWSYGIDSVSANRLLTIIKANVYQSKLFREQIQTLTIAQILYEKSTLIFLYKILQQAKKDKSEKLQESIDAVKSKSIAEQLMFAKTSILEDKLYNKINLPLFCIHSLLGNAHSDYQHSILQQLNIALEALNYPSSLKEPVTLNMIANAHVETIRKQQPKGPYWLLGWSSGGVIAKLAADNLRAQGERVYTFIIDAHHPLLLQNCTTRHYGKELELVAEKIQDKLSVLCDLPSGSWTKQGLDLASLEKSKQIDALIKWLEKNLRQLPANFASTVHDVLTAAEAILKAELAMKVDEITPLRSDDCLLLSSKSQQQWSDKYLGWQNASADNTNIIVGDHFSILIDSNITEVLEKRVITQLKTLELPLCKAIQASFEGNYDKAIEFYTEAIGIDNNKYAYANRARAYLELKRYQEAINDYNQTIKLDSKYVGAFVNRARAYLGLMQYQKAIADYNQAIELNSKCIEAYVNRAIAYSELKRYQAAIDSCNQAIKLDSKCVGAYVNRAIAYSELEQYEAAIADCNKAIKLNPKCLEACVARARAYLELKQYEAAIADCNQAIKLDSKCIEAYVTRAKIHYELKQYQAAKTDCNQTIELDPKRVRTYVNRAAAYLRLKEYQAAIADCNQAIELDSKCVEAYDIRASIHFELKKYQVAITDYNQAIELDPKYVSAYVNRAAAYLRLKEYPAALADSRQAIELDSKCVGAYVNHASIHFELKQYQEAIADYTQTIKLNSKHVGAYVNRAIAYFELKQYQEAIAGYNKAIKLNPKCLEAYANRAAAYLRLGQYRAAVDDFSQFSEAKEILSKVEPIARFTYRAIEELRKMGCYQKSWLGDSQAERNYLDAYFKYRNCQTVLINLARAKKSNDNSRKSQFFIALPKQEITQVQHAYYKAEQPQNVLELAKTFNLTPDTALTKLIATSSTWSTTTKGWIVCSLYYELAAKKQLGCDKLDNPQLQGLADQFKNYQQLKDPKAKESAYNSLSKQLHKSLQAYLKAVLSANSLDIELLAAALTLQNKTIRLHLPCDNQYIPQDLSTPFRPDATGCIDIAYDLATETTELAVYQRLTWQKTVLASAKPPTATTSSSNRHSLFKTPVVEDALLPDSIETNDLTGLSTEIIQTGRALLAAFNDKQHPQEIAKLVAQGAPVNYRLSYGLEIKLEADFVASFFLLLEGDKGSERLRANAEKIAPAMAQGLTAYLATSLQIRERLYQAANQQIIAVNHALVEQMLAHPAEFRADPDKQNGALIIAAGLRNPELVKQLIVKGKSYPNVPAEQNGALVNFKGYFEDTAAVWSAILLDVETLTLLIQHGAEMDNIGIAQNSLLHWVVVAARLDSTPERQQRALAAAELLLESGASPDIPNKLSKTPLDYAQGALHELLQRHKSASDQPLKLTM